MDRVALEIEHAISLRPEFPTARDHDVRRAAKILVLNGILSISELRATPKRNRDFLIEDLRKNGYTYPQLKFLLQLCDVFPSLTRNPTGNQKIEIEEVCIPREIQAYKPDLSGLSSLWRPDQAMVNFFSNETARAAAVVPAFVPYPNPDLTKKPWIPNETPIGSLYRVLPFYLRIYAENLYFNPIFLLQSRRKRSGYGKPRCAG